MRSKKITFSSSFYVLLTATAISAIGDGIRKTGIPLFAIHLTHKPMLISLVSFSSSLPWLGIALLSGVFVDRLHHRNLMVAINGIRTIVALVLAGIAFYTYSENAHHSANSQTVWTGIIALVLVGFALAMGETFFDPAAQAILPAIVCPKRLELANGRLFSLQIAGERFIGPPIGGVLLALFLPLPFLCDAMSFCLAAILTSRIHVLSPIQSTTTRYEPILSSVKQGLSFLWSEHSLRAMAVILGIMMFIEGGIDVVLALFAQENLHLSSTGYGLLITSLGIGDIIGSLVMPFLMKQISTPWALTLAVTIYGIFLLLIGIVSSIVFVFIAYLMIGFTFGMWNIITVSYRQKIIPSEIFGRVTNVYRTIGWGSTSLGSLLGGILANFLGLRSPFILGGIVLIGTGFLTWKIFHHLNLPRNSSVTDYQHILPSTSPSISVENTSSD